MSASGSMLANVLPTPAMLALMAISFVAAIAMLCVFGRCSNQQAITDSKNRVNAHLLELRLFSDEPALVFKAQLGLLAANARLIWHVLPPVLILTAPMIVAFVYADAFFGRAPLRVGEPAIVTIQMNTALAPDTPAPTLEAAAPFAVETPAVRILAENEVSWRIRPRAAGRAELRIVTAQGAVTKGIQSGKFGLQYLPGYRGTSASSMLLHASEVPFSDPAVSTITIHYPAAELSWLGIEMHWVVWFLIFSMATALIFKRRMGVAF